MPVTASEPPERRSQMDAGEKPTVRARMNAIVALVRQVGLRKTVTMLATYWSQRAIGAVRRKNA